MSLDSERVKLSKKIFTNRKMKYSSINNKRHVIFTQFHQDCLTDILVTRILSKIHSIHTNKLLTINEKFKLKQILVSLKNQKVPSRLKPYLSNEKMDKAYKYERDKLRFDIIHGTYQHLEICVVLYFKIMSLFWLFSEYVIENTYFHYLNKESISYEAGKCGLIDDLVRRSEQFKIIIFLVKL
ncbi:hypothetical protein A3Q56_05213, partial [Intoshia linei]